MHLFVLEKVFNASNWGEMWTWQGIQRVEEICWICVELCVVRLPSVGTDLLITLSAPSKTNPHHDEESSAMAVANGNDNRAAFLKVFQQVISSSQIRDWSLFV